MSVEQKLFRPILTFIAIAGLLYLAHSGYCYYEDPNEDGYCAIIMRGDFTGGPDVLPNSSGLWIGLTYALKDLFQWKPGIDWYGVIVASGYCFLLFQISQLIPLIYSGLKKTAGKWLTIALLFCIAVFFSENLFLWQFTRLSLLLSGLSLFRIWMDIRAKENPAPYSRSSYLLNVICFTYAACLRPEPAVLNLVIWLPLAMLDYVNGASFKKYTAFIPPVLIIGLLSVIVNHPINEADSNYLAFRKYQFSFFDYKQPVSSLKINTAKDSMIYTAATTAFLSDSANLNTAYFKRVGILPMDKTPSSIPYYFHNLSSGPGKIKRALEKLTIGSPGLTIFYFLCMLCGFAVVYAGGRKKLLWYALSQLWPIFLFLGVTVFMKMENRVLVPMMWCFLIQNLVWCYNLANDNRVSSKMTTMFAIIIMLIAAPAVKLDASKIYSRWTAKKHEEKEADKLAVSIHSQTTHIIVINDNACSKFYIRPFKPSYSFPGKKIICLNYFQLFWLASYGPYMESVFGKRDLPGIMEALKQRKNDVTFVSKINRMEFIENYLKVVYNMDLPYAPVDTSAITAGKTPGAKNSEVTLYRFI